MFKSKSSLSDNDLIGKQLKDAEIVERDIELSKYNQDSRKITKPDTSSKGVAKLSQEKDNIIGNPVKQYFKDIKYLSKEEEIQIAATAKRKVLIRSNRR